MKNKLAWIILGVIAIIAAALLATTNEVTKDVIAAANEAATQEAWAQLVPGAEFPDAQKDEDGEAEETEQGSDYVYAGIKDGEVIGYVGQTTVQGYGGPIDIIVGTDTEGVITGINVGGANFSETAGLGAKAKDAAFTDQFAGKVVPLTVGEDIDAITASTITSNAVVRGVNTAVENIAKVAGFTIETAAAEGGALGDGRYAATTKGFAGPVYVEILLDDSNVIEEITIGDDQFAETSGYGLKAQEPSFYEQFIGKTGQLELGTDIDGISGATITSKAVVDAVNMAMLYATDPDAAAALAGGGDFELPEIPDNALTETASRKGFGGPVAATITIDPDTHELLMVEFGDDAWAETDGIGTRILDEDFWHQFIGKVLPIGEGEIDLLAGATITSQAALEAVNKAYDKLFPSEEGGDAGTDTPTEPVDLNGASASSKGYGGPVAAKITVEDGGNVLTAVEFGDDKWAETDGLGSRIKEDEFVQQFIGKALPLGDGDVDIIATATVTSEAAIAAVNKAWDKIVEARGAAGDTGTPAAEGEGRTESASSKGYAGPVAAKITVDDNNVLTAVEFGDDNWAETDGLGSQIKEDAFVQQFTGKTLPLQDGDIDTITNATVTSEAAIAAVNKAFDKLTPQAEETEPEATDTPAAEVDLNSASASSKGYAGPVAAKVTVEDGGNVLTAVEFGDDNWAETDGLGSRIKEDEFVQQFIGKALPLGDGDVDIIATATVTSEAAIAAVNKAWDKIVEARGAAGDTDAPATEGEGRTESASSKGYAGPVAAKITVDENDVLTAVEFGDDNWAETDGLGSQIKEDAFIQQFIGKTLPLQDGDIDTITNATVTSEAAIAAVNKAFDKLAPQAEEPKPEPTDTPSEPEAAANTASASSKGYAGPVAAKITIDENNVLTDVEFGDENWAETDGLGSQIKEDAFIQQFIGKTLPLQDGDIDTITNATVTSEAAIAAVNKAFDKIAPQEEPEAENDPNTAEATVGSLHGTITAKLTVDADDKVANIEVTQEKYLDESVEMYSPSVEFLSQIKKATLPIGEGDIDIGTGATATNNSIIDAVNQAFDIIQKERVLTGDITVSASSKGYGGPVAAMITVDVAGTLKEVVFGDDNWAETEGLGSQIKEDAFVQQFIGKTLPLADGDIDIITNATVTSEAAIAAVNKAYDKAVAMREEAAKQARTTQAPADGYRSPVVATITVDENDVLTSVFFGDDSWNETAGIAEAINGEVFTGQFIGKTLPIDAGDIDILAYATVTSEAAINAVNKAFEKLQNAQ